MLSAQGNAETRLGSRNDFTYSNSSKSVRLILVLCGVTPRMQTDEITLAELDLNQPCGLGNIRARIPHVSNDHF